MRLANLARLYGPSAAARDMRVSRDTAYHWLARYEAGGTENLHARPRGKPLPKAVTPEVAERLAALHAENPRRSAAKVARLYAAEAEQPLHRSTVWAARKKSSHDRVIPTADENGGRGGILSDDSVREAVGQRLVPRARKKV